MPAARPRTVFIASDGTGRTGEQVVRSALVQFHREAVELVIRSQVRSSAQILRVVEEASAAQGMIFFTLVDVDARREMKETANAHHVESVDVLGPVFSGLNSLLHHPPRAEPGLYYESERAYFDRIDAIDYTLKHDDGQRLHELRQADVVLVGVSRASKSSTCFYLAYRGIRAANVPLLPNVEPPEELLELDSRRVIGLAINCQRLMAIRQARLATMGVADLNDYVDAEAVRREVGAIQTRMSDHDWRRIDVSYMAIEEIANNVLRLMKEAKLPRRPRRRRARS